MYKEYLKEAYKIYEQIKSEYTKHVKTSKTKQILYHLISKELRIPLIDIESAIVVIEEKQSELFREKAEDLIGEYIEYLIMAKAKEDMETVNRIQLLLKKDIGISTNTINKYIKIVIFQDAVKLDYELNKIIWSNDNTISASGMKSIFPLAATMPIAIFNKYSVENFTEEEVEDVQDKLEESVGEVETDVDEEENPYSEQSASTEEDNLEVLRKELVFELFKQSCCDCEEEGFFTRTINKIKSFFKGK